MNKFQEYHLSLGEKETSIIENYISRITEYTKKHHIDADVLVDIEDMLFEKLANEQNLNELKIRKILKAIGEPEAIFSDYTEESSRAEPIKNEQTLFYEDLKKE